MLHAQDDESSSLNPAVADSQFCDQRRVHRRCQGNILPIAQVADARLKIRQTQVRVVSRWHSPGSKAVSLHTPRIRTRTGVEMKANKNRIRLPVCKCGSVFQRNEYVR
jgi:hypothetical protein